MSKHLGTMKFSICHFANILHNPSMSIAGLRSPRHYYMVCNNYLDVYNLFLEMPYWASCKYSVANIVFRYFR